MNEFQKSALNAVLDAVLSTEYEDFQKQVDGIIDKNCDLSGSSLAFVFLDRQFSRVGVMGRTNQGLHLDLHPEMHVLMTRLKTTEQDRQIMSQVLGKLVSSCQTLEDLRNELPECIVVLRPDLWGQYPRTREAARSISGSERDRRQYEKVLVKIRFYCAMRLVV